MIVYNTGGAANGGVGKVSRDINPRDSLLIWGEKIYDDVKFSLMRRRIWINSLELHSVHMDVHMQRVKGVFEFEPLNKVSGKRILFYR